MVFEVSGLSLAWAVGLSVYYLVYHFSSNHRSKEYSTFEGSEQIVRAKVPCTHKSHIRGLHEMNMIE